MTHLDDWVGRNIPEVVLNDAAAWMALLDSERCNPADRVAFARWLDEDPCHQWAFEELSEVWARLHTLVDVPAVMAVSNVVPLRTGPATAVNAKPAPRSDWTALVASVLVMLGVVVHVMSGKPMEVHSNPLGSTSRVTLADGSSMNLDARSEVHVRIDGDSRYIELASGEAFLDVVADGRPFVIKTPRATVTATAGELALALTDEAFEVAVLEGSIDLTYHDRLPALTEVDASSLTTLVSSTSVLKAGEELRVTAEGRLTRQFDTLEMDRRLSWRSGMVEFAAQPLGSVVRQMRRYLDVNIHIADPELAALRINGRFPAGNNPAFLQDLEDNPAIMVDRADARWVILRSPLAAVTR